MLRGRGEFEAQLRRKMPKIFFFRFAREIYHYPNKFSNGTKTFRIRGERLKIQFLKLNNIGIKIYTTRRLTSAYVPNGYVGDVSKMNIFAMT